MRLSIYRFCLTVYDVVNFTTSSHIGIKQHTSEKIMYVLLMYGS